MAQHDINHHRNDHADLLPGRAASNGGAKRKAQDIESGGQRGLDQHPWRKRSLRLPGEHNIVNDAVVSIVVMMMMMMMIMM